MKFSYTIIFRNYFFFYFLIICGWLASCGLRTAPHYLPEIKQKSTFSEFKVQQRDERIRLSWKINETERVNALKKYTEDEQSQEYFLIQEFQKPLNCLDCKPVEKTPLRLLTSNSEIIRESNQLYYYLEIPRNDLNLRQFKLSHIGADDEILSPAKIVKFRQNKLFPKVPVPLFKIVQIDDERQTVSFSFAKVVLKKTILKEDDVAKIVTNKKSETDDTELKTLGQNQQTAVRTFILRFTWPKLSDKGLKRLQGEGDYFEEKESFQVNLYRRRNGEKWPEIPINSKLNANNYYLDKLELQILPYNRKQLRGTQQDNLTARLPFYVDLRGQNSDTWLYQLRLEDRFGNESVASETITVNLPSITINGQRISETTDVPLTD